MTDNNPNQHNDVQPPAGNSGQADGSPPSGDGPSGHEDGSGDAGQNGSDLRTQVKELRRRLTTLGEEKSLYERVLMRASQEPEWQTIKSRLNGGEDTSATKQEVDELISGMTKDPAAQQNLRRLLEIHGTAVRQDVLREVSPAIQQTRQVVARTEYQKGLQDAGLDPEVAEDPDFQEFVSDVEMDNPWVKEMPAKAKAKYLGDNFRFQRDTAKNWQLESRRIQRARDGSLESPGGGSGRQVAGAAGAVTLSRSASMAEIAEALEKTGGDESKLNFVD